MLAALESLSFLTLSKKASSLLVRNFSIDNSVFEFSALRLCSFWTKSAPTPPSASVNYNKKNSNKIKNRHKQKDVHRQKEVYRCDRFVKRWIGLFVHERGDRFNWNSERFRRRVNERVGGESPFFFNGPVGSLEGIAKRLCLIHAIARAIIRCDRGSRRMIWGRQ